MKCVIFSRWDGRAALIQPSPQTGLNTSVIDALLDGTPEDAEALMLLDKLSPT